MVSHFTATWPRFFRQQLWRWGWKWKKMGQLCYPFYRQTTVHARYYHILWFLHFMDNNRNGVDRRDDRLWKIRDLFEIIKTHFSKFYNPTEHLAVDEVIVKFKGRKVFKHYIQKKKRQTFRHYNFQTAIVLDTRMTWVFTFVKAGKGRHNTWHQPTLQWLIYQER